MGQQPDDPTGGDSREGGEFAGEVSDPRLDRKTVGAAVEPQDPHAPAISSNHAHQQPDGGGLPGPVWSHEAEHLATADIEVETEDAVAASVVLGEITAADRRQVGGRRRRARTRHPNLRGDAPSTYRRVGPDQ